MAELGIASDRMPMMISAHVAQNIDRILGAVRSHLRMDVAFVSEFLGQNRIFRSVDSSLKSPPLFVGAAIDRDAACDDPSEGPDQFEVALLEIGIGRVAEAAQRAEDPSVIKPDRHAQMRPDGNRVRLGNRTGELDSVSVRDQFG